MDYGKILYLEPIRYFCEFDQVFKIEEWRDLPDYEGIYNVSDLGRVKSLKRFVKMPRGKYRCIEDKILKPVIDKLGYSVVRINKFGTSKTVKVHQLVAISFLKHIPNGKNDFVVDHKNNIKSDNMVFNLQIITHRENASKDKKGFTSKYVGVFWGTREKKWQSKIYIDGKSKFLGYFFNEIDAHHAYQNALNTLIIKNN